MGGRVHAGGHPTCGGGGAGAVAGAVTEPTKQGPGFAYQEVVRRKADRDLLPGHECVDCARWYQALRTWGDAAVPLAAPPCGHAGTPLMVPDDREPTQREVLWALGGWLWCLSCLLGVVCRAAAGCCG